jgi:DNA-binding SARP family transcriptional activator/pimeloyl-ACP methyl ester carboxylesterase
MGKRVPGLSLRLFGHPELRAGGVPLPIGRRHVLALITILAETGRALPRARVAEMLWPETDEPTVRARLRRLVHRAGEAIGAVIRTDGDTLALDAGAIALDSLRFVALAEAGLASREAASLEAAAALQQAPFLDGFELPDAPGFADWVLARRAELERLQMRVLRTLAEALGEAGEHERTVGAASRLLALDPFRESSHRLLMRVQAQAGAPEAVDAAYRACVKLLAEELGTKPSGETEAEYQRLKNAPAAPAPIHSLPQVRFASADGGSVAYASVGRGPALLVIPGFVSHIEMVFEEPRLRTFIARLAETHQVLMFDRRGLGLSERLGIRPSVDTAVSDIRAILDHAGVRRAILFGASEGGPIAIRFACESPERAAGLVLFGTLARGSWSPDYPWALKRDALDLWRERLLADWGKPASLETFAPSAQHEPELRAWYARLLRLATTPASLGFILRALADTDIRDQLPQVRTPTVVLHRRGDLAVRFGAGEHLAQHIPGARFLPLDGTDHWWFIGDQQPVFDAIADVTRAAEP